MGFVKGEEELTISEKKVSFKLCFVYETLVHQHTFSVCVSDLICHTSINNITVMLGIYVVNVQVLYLTLNDIFQIFENSDNSNSMLERKA